MGVIKGMWVEVYDYPLRRLKKSRDCEGVDDKPESFVPRKDFLQFAQGNEKTTSFFGASEKVRFGYNRRGWNTVCFHHGNNNAAERVGDGASREYLSTAVPSAVVLLYDFVELWEELRDRSGLKTQSVNEDVYSDTAERR